MHKLLFFLFFLLGFQTLQAQLFSGDPVLNLEDIDEHRWSYGYYLGVSYYDFKFDYKDQQVPGAGEVEDIQVNRNPSFNIGLIGNMRINNYLDLRLEPGVHFGVKRALIFPDETLVENQQNRRVANSTYIQIPLMLKFSAKRINNFRPFIMGGFSTSFNLGSNEKNPDDNYGGHFRMKTNTFYYELAFGIDLYMFYFKLSPSIRAVFALTDELVRDNERPDGSPSRYTSNIDGMYTRGVFLNLTFQ